MVWVISQSQNWIHLPFHVLENFHVKLRRAESVRHLWLWKRIRERSKKNFQRIFLFKSFWPMGKEGTTLAVCCLTAEQRISVGGTRVSRLVSCLMQKVACCDGLSQWVRQKELRLMLGSVTERYLWLLLASVKPKNTRDKACCSFSRQQRQHCASYNWNVASFVTLWRQCVTLANEVVRFACAASAGAIFNQSDLWKQRKLNLQRHWWKLHWCKRCNRQTDAPKLERENWHQKNLHLTLLERAWHEKSNIQRKSTGHRTVICNGVFAEGKSLRKDFEEEEFSGTQSISLQGCLEDLTPWIGTGPGVVATFSQQST